MSRPKGSLNKSTILAMQQAKAKGNGVFTMNFEKQIQNAPITKPNAQYGIINFGVANDYPYKLIDLYNTSVTHRACIDYACNAIIGDGIDWDSMKVKNGDIPNPNYTMGWNQFIRALAFDFCLYSAFSFQIIRSRDGKSYTFYPQPIETVRLEEADNEGVINNAYLCKDWTATGKYPPVKIPIFGFQEDKEIPIGVPHLFYYKRYNPVNFYYGLPVYSSALNAIQAEAQYQTWDLKNITNGFTAVGALTLPQVETDEERQAVIANITRMFTSAENSNSLLITFRDSIEDKPVEYTPFQQSTTNINMYQDANERTINRIMAAHRINSKALIGFPADDTGFSNSGEYMEEAYRLYNINVANNNRREILDVVNTLFKANGVDVEIVLKPLRYKTDGTDTTVNTTDQVQGDTATEDEVEEREKDTI